VTLGYSSPRWKRRAKNPWEGGGKSSPARVKGKGGAGWGFRDPCEISGNLVQEEKKIARNLFLLRGGNVDRKRAKIKLPGSVLLWKTGGEKIVKKKKADLPQKSQLVPGPKELSWLTSQGGKVGKKKEPLFALFSSYKNQFRPRMQQQAAMNPRRKRPSEGLDPSQRCGSLT